MLELHDAKGNEAGVFADVEITSFSSREALDNEDLAKLGKKPVLKRNFGFFTMLGLASAVMITWEGTLILLGVQLENGGLAGSVYGYLFVWFGVVFSSVTMAEMASMAPTAGGQYHWVAILAPEQARVYLSYLIGWLTLAGWQAGLASTCFLLSQQFLGLAVLDHPDFVIQPWHQVLAFWAVLALAVAMNTLGNRILPKLEGAGLVIHVGGFVAILAVLAALAPRGDASQVFTSFTNGGSWPTQGVSFFVGALGPAFAILGADGPVHLSEEIVNSARNVPKTIVYGAVLNGAIGFAILLVCLFGIGDIDTVLATPTGFAYFAIFQQTVGSARAAIGMAFVPILMAFICVVSFVATTSRSLWSFARDKGVPGWSWISKVDERSHLPLNSIALSCLISVLLSLIDLGSSVALNDVVSLTVSGLYSSYLTGSLLLLYRRVRGHIKPYDPSDGHLRNTIGADRLSWGPWKLPEPWETAINALGCCYLLILFFFSFWPPAVDPVPSTMNYSSLMLGGIVILATLYYVVRGRKIYSGPVIEINME